MAQVALVTTVLCIRVQWDFVILPNQQACLRTTLLCIRARLSAVPHNDQNILGFSP